MATLLGNLSIEQQARTRARQIEDQFTGKGSGKRRFAVLALWNLLALSIFLLAAGGLAGTSLAAPALGTMASTSGGSHPDDTGTGPDACQYSGQVVSSPNSGSSDNQLEATAAIATNDVWAVGYSSSGGGRTLTEHWDGNAWSIVTSPNVGSSNTLYSVAAVASNDVWAVGSYYNTGNGTFRTLAEHWNGSAWSIVSTPGTGGDYAELVSVAAVASNDVWAVGYYQNGSIDQSLAMHWNGAYWSIVSSLNVGSDSNDFYSVSAMASNDVWAVGYFKNTFIDANRVLVEHWDGTHWSVVSCPNVGTSYENEFQSVVAVASNDVWAVGDYTDDNDISWTLTEHWNGTAWSIVTSPGIGPYGNKLYGVAATAGNDVWAVGDYKNINNVYRTLALHWNGSSWAAVTSPNAGTNSDFLQSVAVAASNDVWAVSFYEDSADTSRTLAVHFTATCPTATPTRTATHTSAATATSTPGGGPVQCPLQFTDVDMSNTFYGNIRCLACRGIVSGYQDGTFRPGNDVTRGQIAKIVSNAVGFTEAHSTQTFEDIPTNDTFYIYIERLASRSIIGGYPCGGSGEPCGQLSLPYFRPNSNASRGQLAKIACRAFNCQGTPGGQSFEDVPTSSTFYTEIEQLYAMGAINGYQCGGLGEPCGPSDRPYYRAGNNVSRGQTAKIVANVFLPNCQTP